MQMVKPFAARSVIKKVHNFLRVSEIYMSYSLLDFCYSTHAHVSVLNVVFAGKDR